MEDHVLRCNVEADANLAVPPKEQQDHLHCSSDYRIICSQLAAQESIVDTLTHRS